MINLLNFYKNYFIIIIILLYFFSWKLFLFFHVPGFIDARPAAGFLFSRASKDNELQMVSKHLCLNIFLDNKTGPLFLDMYLNLPTPCHLSLSSKQSMVVKIARVASSRICLLKSLKCQLMATVSTTFEEKNYCFYCVPFKWTICCRKYELMITKIWTDRFIDPCPSPFMKNEMLLALRKWCSRRLAARGGLNCFIVPYLNSAHADKTDFGQ